MRDGQWRHARRLHHGNQTPETAGERIIAARHGPAGIRLADGAGDGINTARARAAATVRCVPVNGITLRQRADRDAEDHAAECGQRNERCFGISIASYIASRVDYWL